jgi:phage-related protein
MAAEEKNEPAKPKPKKKPLHWIASSRRDLRAFPEEVKDIMGFALYQAQMGGKHESAKVLKGFKGAGVLEIVDDHDGDTYRGVYTVKFEGVVYVLDAFQKKAKKGIRTPPQDIERIKKRLQAAERHSKMRSQAKKEK